MANTHVELLHLLSDVLSSFQSHFVAGISEYEIISILQKRPYRILNEHALSDSLLLFQTHFIVFHVLYSLRKQWRESKVGELDIGPSLIKLNPLHLASANIDVGESKGTNIQAPDPLADYYLDWQNLASTQQTDVDELLSHFWQKMAGNNLHFELSQDELNKAKSRLEISSTKDITLIQLKQQYRKLQHQYHPDKGGSIEISQLILQAYTTLHKYLSNG